MNRPPIFNDPSRKLYVDATGLLALGGFAPTGIPRVQAFLVQQAIEDTDPNVLAVVYEKRKGNYRSLSQDEEAMLTSVSSQWPADETRKLDLFRAAVRIARNNPYLGKEFDRIAAARITRRSASGSQYFLVKTLIRGYRLYQRMLRPARLKQSYGETSIDGRNGIVLMSNLALLGSKFSASMQAMANRAFICHDLIPSQHPEFVGDLRQARRFVEQLTFLVRGEAYALCPSNFTCEALLQFATRLGRPDMRSDKFPMPSTLYEKAELLEPSSTTQFIQPYVLYCSTVEVRKNHLLLAKIWKRALDEGVTLPKLICVGKWGWGVGELRNYLRGNPELHESVRFVGPVSDEELIDYYRGALFGLVPSYTEGWGLGASECLDFQVPVIVSTAPALQEATRSLMPAIDPDDEDAWYAKIRELSSNVVARQRLVDSIQKSYRPIASLESWRAIKESLQKPSGSAQPPTRGPGSEI